MKLETNGKSRNIKENIGGDFMVNIIIADKDGNIRKQLIDIIEGSSQEFNVVAQVSNGDDILETIKNLKPDILITDISMYEMDFIELMVKIEGSYIETRTIVLSKLDDYKYVRAAFIGGAVDYLLKPVNGDELMGTLNKVKGNKQTKKIQNRKYKKGKKVIERAKIYIDEHYNHDISLKIVADYVFLNANYFSTLFKEETGINFIDYLIDTRIVAAKKLLNLPGVKVYEVARTVGYEEVVSFNRAFKKIVGITPKEYVSSSIHYHL